MDSKRGWKHRTRDWIGNESEPKVCNSLLSFLSLFLFLLLNSFKLDLDKSLNNMSLNERDKLQQQQQQQRTSPLPPQQRQSSPQNAMPTSRPGGVIPGGAITGAGGTPTASRINRSVLPPMSRSPLPPMASGRATPAAEPSGGVGGGLSSRRGPPGGLPGRMGGKKPGLNLSQLGIAPKPDTPFANFSKYV